MLNKVEVEILKYLYYNQLNNPMNSQTIKSLSKTTKLNYFRLRNIINHLCLLGLCSQGYKEGNANTYYISLKGIKKEDDLTNFPEV